MADSASLAFEQATKLSQQYAPWCLLHMLLKKHPDLFSILLLEELLAPVSNPSSSSANASTTSPSHSPRLSQSRLSSELEPKLRQQHQRENTSGLREHPLPQLLPQPHSLKSPPSAIQYQNQQQKLQQHRYQAHQKYPEDKAKAALSRYLVQRLHFGYYGNRTRLSEAAVRYLTARARLQFGYFVIRGRAFWNVTLEDLGEEHSQHYLEQHQQQEHFQTQDGEVGIGVTRLSGYGDRGGGEGGGDGKSGATGSSSGSSSSRTNGGAQDQQQQRRQRRHQQLHEQSSSHSGSSSSSGGHSRQGRLGQQGGDEADNGGNKDEESYGLGSLEAATLLGRRRGGFGVEVKDEVTDEAEKRERIAQGNQRCEEREEKLLMREAVRYLERRQPDLIDVFLPILASPSSSSLSSSTTSASSSSPTSTTTEAPSERQAVATYWTQVALTQLIDTLSTIDGNDLPHIPSSPFLNRRTDALWLERLQQPPRHPWILKEQGVGTGAGGSGRSSQPAGGMRMVQDDARLFQIASGIFDKLATYPKKSRKPAHGILEEPLTYAPLVVRDLIVEYGYMPLPEDERDRKLHSKGGNRACTGEAEVFPSDGSHVVNRRAVKGQGSSIWYFYDIQSIEVMVVYLMHRAPEVLDLLFERGFELMVRGAPTEMGLSRALLLQCSLPGCHAMVRHVYQLPATSSSSTASIAPFNMPAYIVVDTVKTELLGCRSVVGSGKKPKRIEFRQEDFVQVLRGVPPVHLSDTLGIMADLGMENKVVQGRLMELLQTPGGPAPVDVEKSILCTLFLSCVHDSRPLASEPLMSATEVVNLAMQQSFEIQMDPSEARDLEWKYAFEEAVVNLTQACLIVHPDVSDWILLSLDPPQVAFQICFDHALMEALLGVAEWNMTQVRRLRRWTRSQEKEARMRSIRTGRQWEEVKKRLVMFRHYDRSRRGQNDRHVLEGSGDDDDDTLMPRGTKDYGNRSSNSNRSSKKRIGLDIEWITNNQVTAATSTIVANMPKGSEMVRISDDGHLLLDNGCLDQALLLCDHWVSRAGNSPESAGSSGGDVLDTNERLFGFLRKNAVVEEKHWIWLAMGLVTVSLQGPRVIEIPDSERLHRSFGVTDQDSSRSIPVKMACSPEAYQLVWMVALAYIQQSLATMTASPQAIVLRQSGHQTTSGGSGDGDTSASAPSRASTLASTRPASSPSASVSTGSISTTATPPSSPVPQSACACKIRELQRVLTSRLGSDARLVVEILSEIEGEIEDQLLGKNE